MTQPAFLRLALGFATLLGLTCLPAMAGAVESVEINDIIAFKGTATDIGVQRGPGQIGGIEYRIEGKFVYTGPMNLASSTMTFYRFLEEEGGSGEMVLTMDNADLVCSEDSPDTCDATLPTLFSSSSSKLNEAKYETPARFRPQMRVQIKRKGNEFQFNVRLDRGLSPQVLSTHPAPVPEERQFPQLCEIKDDSGRMKTDMRTAFTIADSDGNEAVLDFTKAWECSQEGRYHLRSR